MALPKRAPAAVDPAKTTAQAMAALIKDARATAHSSVPALPIGGNPAFFLMHWPGEWHPETEGLEQATWLPLLSRHIILPGCNLNRTIRKGEAPEAAYDQAVLKNTRRGAVYLLPTVHRLADGGMYIQEAPCRNPRNNATGIYYLEAWMRPKDVIPGRKLKFSMDRAKYNQFRLRMVHTGAIHAPSLSLLEDTMRRRHSELRRRKSLRGLEKDEYKRQLKEVKEVLEFFEGAIVPQYDPAIANAALGGA